MIPLELIIDFEIRTNKLQNLERKYYEKLIYHTSNFI